MWVFLGGVFFSGGIPDHSAAAAHRGRRRAELQPTGRKKEEPGDQKNCLHQADSAGAGQRQEPPR